MITTGGSSLECAKIVKKLNARLLGFASLIDRSENKKLKIRKSKIVSQIKIKIPAYNNKNIPDSLKKVPITVPGSRYLK